MHNLSNEERRVLQRRADQRRGRPMTEQEKRDIVQPGDPRFKKLYPKSAQKIEEDYSDIKAVDFPFERITSGLEHFC